MHRFSQKVQVYVYNIYTQYDIGRRIYNKSRKCFWLKKKRKRKSDKIPRGRVYKYIQILSLN